MAHGSRSSADSARKQRVQEALLLNYTKFEKKKQEFAKNTMCFVWRKVKKNGHLLGSFKWLSI